MNYTINKIISDLCAVPITTSILGIVLLTAIWCVYFMSRVRELGRKIHYLRKQREESCYEELINAKVDYIKSVFIAVISGSEVLALFVTTVELSINNNIDKMTKINNCTGNYILVESYYYTGARVIFALGISSILIYTSLIHTLTSYLSHAYAIKRVVSLARRDKVLLVWLLTQLILIWISIAYWRAFIFVFCAIIISLFPIHLCLYIKYSSSLYLLLKWRRLDAWFEDPQSHKRLDGMCREYKTGSILYIVSVVLIGIASVVVTINVALKLLLTQTCFLNLVFNSNFPWLQTVYKEFHSPINVSFKILDITYKILFTCTFVFIFALHLYIMSKAVRRLWKRRIAYNTGAKEMYRPLLVSN